MLSGAGLANDSVFLTHVFIHDVRLSEVLELLGADVEVVAVFRRSDSLSDWFLLEVDLVDLDALDGPVYLGQTELTFLKYL